MRCAVSDRTPGVTDRLRAYHATSASFGSMTEPLRDPDDVTALLMEWREGDPAALERLVPLVYAELKKARLHICATSRRAAHCKRPRSSKKTD